MKPPVLMPVGVYVCLCACGQSCTAIAGAPSKCSLLNGAVARLADCFIEVEGQLGQVAGLAAQLERLQRPKLQAGRLDAQAQARLHRARAGRLQAAQRAGVCRAQCCRLDVCAYFLPRRRACFHPQAAGSRLPSAQESADPAAKRCRVSRGARPSCLAAQHDPEIATLLLALSSAQRLLLLGGLVSCSLARPAERCQGSANGSVYG